jgi:hypothetical protein
MLLADVDADGKLDLAVANGNIPGLVIFRGNGAGGFGAPLQFPAPRSFHSSLVAADFDLDGHLDLALQASGLWIYRGDGTGNFVVAARFGVVGPEGEGGSVAAGADLDGDRRVDLAVGRALLFNHPGWDFGAQRQFPVGLLPKAVAAGDMNDDGKTDLVTANAGSHDISVILGNGDGSFGPPIPGPLISSALDLEIADFDGDGHQDVALPDYDASTLRVFRGNGAGGLLSQTTLLLGPGAQPTDVAVGDVNGDGRLDLAVACLGSNSVQIFLGTGGASFVPAPGYFFQRAQAVAFALLNPDVRPDLLVGQAWDGTSSYTALSSLMGSGDGLFLSPQPADAELGAVATLSPGDFDGDGDLDLAVTGAPLGTAVLRGDGFGGFGERQFPVGPEQLKGEYGVASAVSDFNRDGIMDLITDDVGLATGYGDGTFGLLNERFEVGENASALAVADFDGDGYRDVAAAVASANAVTVLLNAPPTTAGADLSVTIAHAPDPATSGAPLVYTIVVSNAGPLAADAVSLRFRSQALPVASSNPGPPTCVLTNVKGEDGFMDCFLGTLAPGASVVVTAVVDVPAGSNGAGLVSDAIVGAATLDLDPNDNRAAHLVSVGPGPADLAVTLADSADPVAPGTPFSYLVTMSNVGTVAVPYSALLDWLPEQVTFVSSNPPICGGGTNPLACNLPPLGVGATFTITINVVAGTFTTVENVVTVVGDFEPDTSNNTAVEATRGALGIARELGHGSSLSEAFPPGTPAERLYYIRQNPHASYEVAVDATAGDVAGPGQTLSLQRLDVDLSPVQDAVAAGAGPSRALRWENASGQAIDAEVVRARSTGCSAACGPGDSYRIRANETTARISRFNTSGTQTTVLLLENATDRPVQGHAWLWDTGGQGVGTLTFNLDAHRTWAVNLASVAPGRNGSITISHNGPTGALGGKAVAIEPATGFTFDTALEYRRR